MSREVQDAELGTREGTSASEEDEVRRCDGASQSRLQEEVPHATAQDREVAPALAPALPSQGPEARSCQKSAESS